MKSVMRIHKGTNEIFCINFCSLNVLISNDAAMFHSSNVVVSTVLTFRRVLDVKMCLDFRNSVFH